MFGSRERLLSYEETTQNGLEVKARVEGGGDLVAQAQDAPPEMFVHKVSDEGGDVYLSPMVEMLRRVFRRRRDEADDAAEQAEGGATANRTLSSMPENAEAPPTER